jgi:hypothetical protein
MQLWTGLEMMFSFKVTLGLECILIQINGSIAASGSALS